MDLKYKNIDINKYSADWDKCFNKTFIKPEFLWSGLKKGTIASIIAPGGVGKGFFGLSIGISLVAKSLIDFIHPNVENSVVYLTAEDPIDILEERMTNFTSYLNDLEKEQVKKGFSVYSITGKFIELIDSNANRNDKSIQFLKQIATNKELLIIDTLRRFHSADENSSGHMTRLISVLEEISFETKCTILFLHHTNKSGIHNNYSSSAVSRGSSCLVDNIRYQMNLTPMTVEEAKSKNINALSRHQYLKIETTKQNYGSNNGIKWLIRDKGGILISTNLPNKKIEKVTYKNKKSYEEIF